MSPLTPNTRAEANTVTSGDQNEGQRSGYKWHPTRGKRAVTIGALNEWLHHPKPSTPNPTRRELLQHSTGFSNQHIVAYNPDILSRLRGNTQNLPSGHCSVGTAGQPGFDSRQGQEIFLFITASRPVLGSTQPPIQWVPVINRPGCEADHSPPSSAEVKNGGVMPPLSYTSPWHGA
jgi:hypothetical protein